MEISIFMRWFSKLFDFYLLQKATLKKAAMRCAYCTLHLFVNSLGWLSAEPCQSNKRGDLRPEFFIMPPFKIAGPGFGAR